MSTFRQQHGSFLTFRPLLSAQHCGVQNAFCACTIYFILKQVDTMVTTDYTSNFTSPNPPSQTIFKISSLLYVFSGQQIYPD